MGPPKDLFTKAALEKLSSPEQLDVLMEVTKAKGWIALASTGFLIIIAILWSIFGAIPIRVDGKGILITGGSLIDVTAGTAGQIGSILVKPGDTVKEGQVIATVGQGKLDQELANSRATLSDLQAKDKTDALNEQASVSLTLKALEQEDASTRSQLAGMAAQIASFRQQYETKKASFAQGFTTQSTVLAAETQMNQAIGQEKALRTRLDSIPADRAKATQTSEAAKSTRLNAIAEQERKVETLERQLDSSKVIHSTHAGRVIEMTVTYGELVTATTRVASLEPLDGKLTGILYVSSGEGKKAGDKMEVRISPSTVKAEEYGFMQGVVRSVSTYPATAEGLMRTLRNQALVTELSGGSAPLEVVVDLIEAKNESGYKWSSPQGPPVGIFGGTMCTGSIIIEKRRPISYVIPLVKEKIGL